MTHNVTRNRRRFAFTLACLLLSAAAVGIYAFRHFRFPSLAETFPDGELVIAIDPSYPPFGSIDNDTFVGLDVDLGAALATELGLTPRYVMVNFDSAYDVVKTGTAHLSLAALRVDPARMGDVFYTWGYLNDGVMLTGATTDGWQLGGMRVAVELGAAAHAEARKWSRRVRDMTITTYATPDEALDALVAGDADAAMVDAISIRAYLRRHPAVSLAADFVSVEFYAGAVRFDRRDVLYHLNGAMLTLLNDGTIESLLDRHVGPAPAVPLSQAP